ncbi:MAG: 2-aminoethylphosphonate aminotransferase [Pseudomonadota bacterium]|nr:2-aminoethylphosphonate aminotransferase [Pseudomonadota bacterium]
MILLNPGPVNLSDGVRQALLGPDLCHREAEFFDLQDEVRQGLLAVYGLPPAYAAVLLGGSGTAAVEAMVASLVPADGRLLVAANGVYGQRLAAIAAIHRIPCRVLEHDWTEAIDLERLERALAAEAFTHLAVVHHETTTGRLNPLAAIGDLARRHGAWLLVDAVSSFGAEELDFDGWHVAAAAATANKCLHGVPGASFVVARRDALETRAPRRSLYLDLATYCRCQDRRDTPYTPPVQALYALAQALRELAEAGGRPARHARYDHLAAQVRRGLEALGIRPLLAAADSSVVLGAYALPAIGYGALHDGLKRQGFVIYAGQGGLAQRLFRIAVMGAVNDADIHRLLTAVEALIKA